MVGWWVAALLPLATPMVVTPTSSAPLGGGHFTQQTILGGGLYGNQRLPLNNNQKSHRIPRDLSNKTKEVQCA